MDAIELKIPKLTLFKNEEKMLFDLQEYLAILESLFYRSQEVNRNRSTAYMIREMKYIENLSSDILEELVSTLGYISSGDTPAKTTTSSNLFTSKLVSKWGKKKNQMKKLFLKYKTEIEKLKEYQVACWKSRSKVDKYCLLVDVAQQSLRCYTEHKTEFHERSVAVNELKRHLGSRCKLHTRNMCKYDGTFMKTEHLRNELLQLSECLEKDITERIKMKLQTSRSTIQPGEDLNLDTISKCIYGIIVHTYEFTEPPSDILHPSFNQQIRIPDERGRMYSSESIKRVFATQKYTKQLESLSDIDNDVKQIVVGSGDLTKPVEKELNQELDFTKEADVAAKKKGFFRAIKKRCRRKDKH